MPEGFTGDDDVWELESPFPFWVLNEWISLNNPNGMFTLLKPRVAVTEEPSRLAHGASQYSQASCIGDGASPDERRPVQS